MPQATIVIIIVAVLSILGIIISGIVIVPQSKSVVVERLGQFKETWMAGVHWRIPLLDRIAKKVSTKEQVLDFDPQDVITKDNVTMKLDAVVFYRITDAKLFAYGAENPEKALYNLTSTTTRNIIGELTLDQTLTSRDTMNERLRSILDEATDPWGVKVGRVEVKNLIPPTTVKEAMEAEMRAEREKRAAIITADGVKTAKITESEGYKAAEILRAEGDARSVELKYEAMKKAITLMNDAKPTATTLTIESLKSLEKVSQGNATKVFLPTDLTKIASLGEVIGLTEAKKTTKK